MLRSVLAVCITVLLCGCDESSPPPTGAPAGSAAPAAPTTAQERIAGAAARAADKIEETAERLASSTQSTLDDFKGRYEQWRAKGGTLQGEAKAAYDRAAAEFDASMKRAQDKLAALKEASGPQLQRARAELEQAMNEARAAFEELKKRAGG